VDRIAAQAEIAPTTLYRLFASKDDLVAAYVERAQSAYREWFAEAVAPDGRSPRERILAVFDALMVQTQPDQSRGCTFLMTLSEFPDGEAACHQHAVALKQWVRTSFAALVGELARESPVGDPGALADQLTLIMEGVYATTQAFGAEGPSRQARALAEAILPTA
jgi:AcrR family transcriptional regulator